MNTNHFKMSYLKFTLLFVIGIVPFMALMGCGGPDAEPDPEDDTFAPVPFPDDLGISGFTFPEPEATIIEWTQTNDQASINNHGWGIWVGLNADSGETFDGESLRVFETWYTPQDILCLMGLDAADCADVQRQPNPVGTLNQLAGLEGEGTVIGFVKYDPTASDHIMEERLFDASQLELLLSEGEGKVPDFPPTAISLKPAFTALTCPSTGCTENDEPLVSTADNGRYYQMRIWPGSDADPGFPTAPNQAGFGPSATNWPDCVWIDTENESTGSGQIDEGCSGTPDSVTPFNVSEFVQFQASSGEYNVLLAMHVTTREITRWTWQSFWWTPTPDTPHLPSSTEIAADRPDELQGAPRNYAMAIAYSMVSPPQPQTGGENVGDSLYAFNPHLEASFGVSVLPESTPGVYQGQSVPNNVGVETNCMSCHAEARYPQTITNNGNANYTGARYVDIDGPEFDDVLRVDFLWSIPSNAVTPTPGP